MFAHDEIHTIALTELCDFYEFNKVIYVHRNI